MDRSLSSERETVKQTLFVLIYRQFKVSISFLLVMLCLVFFSFCRMYALVCCIIHLILACIAQQEIRHGCVVDDALPELSVLVSV